MVDLLKPEYKDRVRFLMADIKTDEGRWFAQFHNVGSVTLLFFNPEGKRVSTLRGVQEADFLRSALDRVFSL